MGTLEWVKFDDGHVGLFKGCAKGVGCKSISYFEKHYDSKYKKFRHGGGAAFTFLFFGFLALMVALAANVVAIWEIFTNVISLEQARLTAMVGYFAVAGNVAFAWFLYLCVVGKPKVSGTKGKYSTGFGMAFMTMIWGIVSAVLMLFERKGMYHVGGRRFSLKQRQFVPDGDTQGLADKSAAHGATAYGATASATTNATPYTPATAASP
mgnify:CR=1 FL=1